MHIITEVVTMKLAVDITRDAFVSIVDGLEMNFHSKQPGFIDSELIYDEKNDTWIMIQHWETAEQLKEASRKIFEDSAAKSFVKCVDPKNVKMIIAPQLGVWK
ncbi:MAG: antibiotic biosynthesis monooxygenase [Defluviitaleaceae bacterium]|nr:antibiotic biosynthesis monooxygenase [Defluviitaleaceae bacterium]